MKELTISEIENFEDKLAFHFCKTESLYPNPNVKSKLNSNELSQGILIEGLVAGNTGYLSSASKDEQPAVFFSLGFKGALGYMNRILTNLSRFETLIEQKPDYVEKFFHKEKEFFLANKNNSNCIYMIAHNYLSNLSYIVLDLKGKTKKEFDELPDSDRQNVDYIIDDIDYANNNQRQTIRNMHSLIGKNISPSKIRKISGNAIEVLIQMYEVFNKKYPNTSYLQTEDWEDRKIKHDYLTRFINYEKQIQNRAHINFSHDIENEI